MTYNSGRTEFRMEPPRALPPPVVPPPTRVALDQDTPVAVEVWPSTVGTVLRVLLGALAVLHAVALVVFLFVAWALYSALADLQNQMQQWGAVLGG